MSFNVDARGAGNITLARGAQHNYVHNPESSTFKALRRASVANAQYNSHHRSCPPCDPDTRTDILNKIFEWASDTDGHSVCWLYGIAGSGKSAIAQSVSELIAENKLAASFFFNRQERERSRKEYIIPTIAYQLAISIPALKSLICDVIAKDETILNATFADQLLKLIIEPLQSLPDSDPSMVIVVDGLDECEDYIEVARLMTQLADPSANTHLSSLRFLVTSRPEPPIRAIFENPGMHSITLHLNLQDFTPDADIRLFLERRLRDIPRLRSEVMSEVPLPWPSNDDLVALVKQSAGLFIYASTLVMFIDDRDALPYKRLETALTNDGTLISRSHTDLDRLYSQILSASSNIDHLMLVIGAIILVRTPLSPRGLSHLLDMELECLQLVLERLHSILSIPDDPDTGVVAPFHLSLHDFLISKHRAGRYFIDPSTTHAQLATICLKRISTLPRYTFPTFRSTMHCWRTMIGHLQQVDTTNRIIMTYTCRYWSFHASELARKDLIMDDIKSFCHHHALPWRIVMEIEAEHNNIIWSPEEMIVHDLRERAWMVARRTWFALVARRTWFELAWEIIIPIVPIAVAVGLTSFFIWQTAFREWLWLCVPIEGITLVFAVIGIGSWVIMPTLMALNLLPFFVRGKKVNAYVLEADLSIKEIPFIWRWMFYRALTPGVASMLNEAMAEGGAGERPDAANTQLETGGSRV